MNRIENLPSTLTISIAPEIFEKFPDTKIAFLLLRTEVFRKKEQPKEMQKYLSELKQRSVQLLAERGISSTNFLETEVVKVWTNVFQTFHTNPERQSTIVNLLKRGAQEADTNIRNGKKANMGDINNFVDFYNAISLSEMTPMGATDVRKLFQNEEGLAHISLRFAKEGESFIPLGKESSPIELTPTSVVYADEAKILTGFWNYKDAKETAVVNESPIDEMTQKRREEYILLVADQTEKNKEGAPIEHQPGDAEKAVLHCQEELHRIGGQWFLYDTLDKKRNEVTFDLSQIVENAQVSLKA